MASKTTSVNSSSTTSPKLLWIRRLFRGLAALHPSLAGWLAFRLMIRPRRNASLSSSHVPDLRLQPIEHNGELLRTYSWPGERRVLLVHGWDSSSADFSALIPRLQQAGWGGVTFDAPGHGESEGRTADFLQMRAALERVLTTCGPFQAVIGHSLGAGVMLYALAHAPASAPAVVVSAGAPATLSLVFEIYANQLQLEPEVRTDLEHRIRKRLGAPAAAFDIDRAAASLPSRLLLIHDQGDRVVPFSSARRLEANAPAAQLLTTSGLGHRGWLRNASVMRQIQTFLDTDPALDSPTVRMRAAEAA